jgi:hypothetical protein
VKESADAPCTWTAKTGPDGIALDNTEVKGFRKGFVDMWCFLTALVMILAAPTAFVIYMAVQESKKDNKPRRSRRPLPGWVKRKIQKAYGQGRKDERKGK